MSDDLLERIGELVREQQRDDARFERAARGDARSEEADELARAAAKDPLVAIRLEASKPLGAEVVDRIAARVMESRAESPLASRVEGAPVFRRSLARRIAILAGPVAVAAAALLFIARPFDSDAHRLPEYTTEARGVQEMRGPTDQSAHIRAVPGKDARFEIVLRPATAPPETVVAYAFTRDSAESADLRPLEASVEIAREGAVRVTGSTSSLEHVAEIRLVVALDPITQDVARERARTGHDDSRLHVAIVPVERR